ncbi:MAG: glutathione S-transferase family protein [Kofleriaceae bacterium]
MKIYGTTTSPFVRRVLVVAQELGEPIERVDTATPAGLKELERISPIRKVPVAIVGDDPDGQPVFDSRAIHAWLTATHGAWGTHHAHESNLVNAIDAAIDSVIQLFYLRRDGIAVAGSAYEQRQLARADAIFAWLAPRVADGTFSGGFGLAELSLICGLDWMEFRAAYPVERAAGCQSVRDRWRDRPSLVSTRPRT